MSKEKIRLILNFINDYIRLQHKLLESNIYNIIASHQKIKPNMGLQELYETEFAKKAKRIESRSLKKGMEKGMEKGILKTKIETILRGVANGCSVSILAAITSLSEKEVSNIIDKYSA